MDERSNGGVFGKLVEFVNESTQVRCVLFSGRRIEDHVAFEVTSSFVVLSV